MRWRSNGCWSRVPGAAAMPPARRHISQRTDDRPDGNLESRQAHTHDVDMAHARAMDFRMGAPAASPPTLFLMHCGLSSLTSRPLTWRATLATTQRSIATSPVWTCTWSSLRSCVEQCWLLQGLLPSGRVSFTNCTVPDADVGAILGQHDLVDDLLEIARWTNALHRIELRQRLDAPRIRLAPAVGDVGAVPDRVTCESQNHRPPRHSHSHSHFTL